MFQHRGHETNGSLAVCNSELGLLGKTISNSLTRAVVFWCFCWFFWRKRKSVVLWKNAGLKWRDAEQPWLYKSFFGKFFGARTCGGGKPASSDGVCAFGSCADRATWGFSASFAARWGRGFRRFANNERASAAGCRTTGGSRSRRRSSVAGRSFRCCAAFRHSPTGLRAGGTQADGGNVGDSATEPKPDCRWRIIVRGGLFGGGYRRDGVFRLGTRLVGVARTFDGEDSVGDVVHSGTRSVREQHRVSRRA